MRCHDIGLALSSLASLSAHGLLRGVTQVSDGFHHPLIILLSAVLLGTVLLCSVLVSALLCSRKILRTLGTLRFAHADDVPIKLSGVATRTNTTSLVRVVDAEALFAFSHGWKRPRIVISTGLVAALGRGELEAVLLHERAHVAKRDPLRVLLARATAQSLAFIPGCKEVLKAYLCRIEVHADRAVVRMMQTPLPLASALLRLIREGSEQAVPGVVGLSPTDVRIDHLLGRNTSPMLVMDRPALLPIASLAAFGLAAVLALLASAHVVSACLPGGAPSC